MYTPQQIANALIERRPGITNLTVQKLVYLAHGHYLGKTGRPLINEAVQAWKHGPVIYSLFHSLKKYGNGPVKPIEGQQKVTEPLVVSLLDKISEVYGDKTASYLVNLTHASGSPWHQVYEQSLSEYGELLHFTTIPNETIRDHYAKKFAENERG